MLCSHYIQPRFQILLEMGFINHVTIATLDSVSLVIFAARVRCYPRFLNYVPKVATSIYQVIWHVLNLEQVLFTILVMETTASWKVFFDSDSSWIRNESLSTGTSQLKRPFWWRILTCFCAGITCIIGRHTHHKMLQTLLARILWYVSKSQTANQ